MYKSIALQTKTVGTVFLLTLALGVASSFMFAPKAEAMLSNITTAPAPAKSTLSQVAMQAKIQELMKLLAEMQKQLAAMQGQVTPKPFGLSDVKSVTSKYVDPSPMMADEEYTLYVITLKPVGSVDGRVIRVKACGYCTTEGRNKQFTDAGYTGDVALLMAMATVVPPSTPTSTSTPEKAEAMARVVLGVSGELGNSGTGNLAKKVIFTDGTSVPFGTWFPLTKDGKAIVDAKSIESMTIAQRKSPAGLLVRRIGGNVVHLVLPAYHASSTSGTTTKNYEYITANLEIKDGQYVSESLREMGAAQLEQYPTNASNIAQRNRDSILMASTKQAVRFSFFANTGADGFHVVYKHKPGTPTPDVMGVSTSNVEAQFDQIVSDFADIVEGYKELVK